MKKTKSKYNMVIIPDTLKESSVQVKFCYLALRNLIYYIDKGMHTQMKYNKDAHDDVISQLISNYFTCAKSNESLSDEECTLIKSCFTSANKSVIPQNDYILGIEKELTFQPFAFYCNVMVELSFHISKEYFDDDYICESVNELSNKLLVNLGDNFVEFIQLDIKSMLETLNALTSE